MTYSFYFAPFFRHCATGEGMFVFHTLEGEKIYRKVHQATLAIAEAHHKNKKATKVSTLHLFVLKSLATLQYSNN